MVIDMAPVEQLDDDLFLIDTLFSATPQAVGVFLLTGERPALIETGPAARVDTVLHGLARAGLTPEDLRAVAVTHIHLDHAAATGALVRRIPHLEVYVHPAGAPHLVDPSRLLASAGRLYGGHLRRLFGEVLPVPEGRIRVLDDQAEVMLGSRRLVALETPGHARHHLVYMDTAAGDLFAGDAAGTALPGSRYVRPPTPPPEFDLPGWATTIDRLLALSPGRLLLAHFGAHTWARELLTQLRERLFSWTELAQRARAAGEDENVVAERLLARMLAESSSVDDPRQSQLLETMIPSRLSVLGIMSYVKKHPMTTREGDQRWQDKNVHSNPD
jgi:glyoxylase-like metal-dependent hydrolase (beta-lactamase superfamily II)